MRYKSVVLKTQSANAKPGMEGMKLRPYSTKVPAAHCAPYYVAMYFLPPFLETTWKPKHRHVHHLSTAGTTASVCIIRKDRMFVANVGGSTVVLGTRSQTHQSTYPATLEALILTKDHKPADSAERERIQATGGGASINRRGGTRGLWLWNVISPKEAVDFVNSFRQDEVENGGEEESELRYSKVADALLEEALCEWHRRRWAADNITISIVYFCESTKKVNCYYRPSAAVLSEVQRYQESTKKAATERKQPRVSVTTICSVLSCI